MNILITNFEIKNYSGSEINAITIAKRLKELGHNVYLAALNFDFPLLYEIQNEVILLNILDGDFDFGSIVFDVVWAHHSFLLDWLIFDKGLKAKKIVNSSLSPVEVFEVPPIYANDINMCIANSKETENKLKSYDINNVYLLENYSFKKYFNREIGVTQLKNIAIVSNHVPDELFEAAEILKEENYNVQIYGVLGKVEYITDKVLENYDLIITIGKTVQYAMSLKIPVYIYDRFGGSGYLTMDNMELNRAHNFSGRGYFKKDAHTIANEIKSEFSKNLTELSQIKEYAEQNFCFEQKIDDVLSRLQKMSDVNIDGIKEKYDRYIRNAVSSKRIAEYLQRTNLAIRNREKAEQRANFEQEIELLNTQKAKEIDALTQKLNQTTDELNEIKGSKAWKLVLKMRRILYGHK